MNGWIRTLLMDVDRKDSIRTSIGKDVVAGRRTEGLDPDGDWKGLQSEGLEGTFLLIVPIDSVVVDCSD